MADASARRRWPGVRVLFLGVFLLLAVLIAWPYLFQGRALAFTDIGSDTWVQFYPLHIAIGQQMRESLDLTWSFMMGLGGYIGAHFDIFWLLQGWLLPESMQLDSRIYVFLFKLAISGVFFLAYLRELGFTGSLAVLGVIAYAFSNYALINGQWDMHGTEVVQFAALLLVLERFLRRDDPLYAVLAGLIVGLGQGFNVYTCGLFVLVYFAARLFVASDAGAWAQGARWRLPVRFGLFALPGFLIAAPHQFPALYYFFDNPRVSGDNSFLRHIASSIASIADRGTLGAELFGLLGKDIIGVGDNYRGWGNYLEGPGFYVGLPALLMATQLLGARASRQEKRLVWLGIIGIALYCVFPAFRYAVYGFGHVAFRLSCLWISMLILVIGLAGLRRAMISGLNFPLLLLGAFAVIVLAVTAMSVLGPDANRVYALTVIVLAIVYAVLAIGMRADAVRSHLPAAVLVVFVFELLLLARPSQVERLTANSDGSSRIGSYQDGTPAALDAIRARHEPTDFYRVEKGYWSVLLSDALVQKYHGVRSYYFHGAGLTRFTNSMGFPRLANSVSYIEAPLDRPLLMDLMSVRYLVTRDRRPDAAHDYVHLQSVNGLEIYQRTGARSLAVLHERLLAEADVASLPIPQRDAALLSGVVVPDPKQFPQIIDTGIAAQQVDLDLLGETRLSGSIRAERPMLLALAMPFDRGWRATLNGEPVTTEQVNFGLLGIVVPAGDHQVAFEYRPPGRTFGWIAALFGIFGAAVILVRRRRDRSSGALPARAVAP